MLAGARQSTRGLGALALALGAGWCLYGSRLAAEARAPAAPQVEAVVEGRVARRSAALDPRWIELEAVRGLSGVGRLRVYATEPSHLDLWLPGDRLRLRGRWASPRPARNPGRAGRDPRSPARAGTLTHPSLAVALGTPGGSVRWLHARRRAIARALRDAGDASGLLRGLALGDREALDPAAREAFRRLGLSHVLAVSGLHLLWVATASFWLSRPLLARIAPLAARRDARRWALLPGLFAATCYAALAGWGIPVRRAWLLLLAAAAAIAAERPARAGAPLAAAALWITARDPVALFDPGAQLSFAVVAALGVSAGRPWQGRRPLPGAEGLRRSATALLVAAPILAWHGAGLSSAALLANAVALPALGAGLLPAALLAALATGLALPGAETLATAAAWLAEATVGALASAAEPLPAVGRGPIAGPVWLAVLGLAAAGLAVGSTVLRCALALLQAGALALAPAAAIAPATPRLVLFDVGQGESALVQGRAASALVDGGGARAGWDAGSRQVVPALNALGVARLDLVIATHADLDHRGGLPAVLAAMPVGELWLPRDRADDPGFARLRAAAARAGVRLREVGRGSPIRRLGDLRIEPLWPPAGASGSRNDASLVVRIAVSDGLRVLLPGDVGAEAEAALLAAAPSLRAEVLVAPHHGSRGSGSAPFLAAVDPRLALVSAGCRNRFGMPHAELRARLTARGIPLFWTGRDGALRVALRGEASVRGTGPRYACPGEGREPKALIPWDG